MINKIVLGTAQLGMDYGINNVKGRISPAEAGKIIETTVKSGVYTFDTAYSYGKGEELLGSFIDSTNNRNNLMIISKLPDCGYSGVKKFFKASLEKLHLSSLYGYLIHNFETYRKDPATWSILEELKSAGKVKKIGFSLYYPEELSYLLERNLKADIIQLPFSILDQRFSSFFAELKRRKTEIFVRSVFLQGLVFRKPINLPAFFKPLAENIKLLHTYAQKHKIPLSGLCLNFVLANPLIDKVIFGVDNLRQLREILQGSNFVAKTKELNRQLQDLKPVDEKIIVPLNWAKSGISCARQKIQYS